MRNMNLAGGTGWGAMLILAAVTIAILGVLHPYPYDNVMTRWALTRQIVEEGTIIIDPYARFTVDKAHFEGHYYCDKPVLTSLAAAAVHLPVHLFDNLIRLPEQLPRYLAERIVIGGCFLLLLLLMIRSRAKDDDREIIPLLALGLGSILLPYSTLLYGHVPAAFLIFLSWRLQVKERFALADLAGAAAAAVEYQVLLLYLILLAYRGIRYWNPLRALRAVGMLLLAFTPQLLHNWLAFGDPLTSGYALEAEESFAVSGRGFFGFTYPSLSTLWMILVSPERGMLFYMPWTAAGFFGLLMGGWKRIRTEPGAVIVVVFVLLFSAQGARTAGWSFGPRYLIPVIPFLAWGLYRFVRGSRTRAFIALMLIVPAMLQAYLGLFGEVHLPIHPVENPVPFPQWNICASMLIDGHGSFWLADILGPIIVMVLSLYALAARFSTTRFSWVGLAWIPPMVLLAVISGGRDWGGRIDYYRGVLARHRGEYSLASRYFFRAMEDPDAPEIVRESALWCLEQANSGRDGHQPSP